MRERERGREIVRDGMGGRAERKDGANAEGREGRGGGEREGGSREEGRECVSY